MGLVKNTKKWTRHDLAMLAGAYEGKNSYLPTDMPKALLARHNKRRCRCVAIEKGFAKPMPRHNCWTESKVISEEKNYNIDGWHQRSRGVWRYRECQVCGKGWETLERKMKDTKKRKPSPNRIRPLSEGWQP